MDHLWFLAIENFLPVYAKHYVLQTLASRADETPTSELSLAGHENTAQQKVSKTQRFSMFFLTDNISGHHLAPMDVHKIEKYKCSLMKRYIFNRYV